MRVERGIAVGADDSQILEPVVVGHAVDVVEDQRHVALVPVLVLAAELAHPVLELRVVETLLQIAAVVRRVFDEHLVERDWLAPPRWRRAGEVLDRNVPFGQPPA